MDKFDEFFTDTPSDQMDKAIFRKAEKALEANRKEYRAKVFNSIFNKFLVPMAASGLAVFGYVMVRNRSLNPGQNDGTHEFAMNGDLFDNMIENIIAEGELPADELLMSEADLDLLSDYDELELISDDDIENS